MSYFAPDHLHDKPTKVRLDEVADDLLTAMARFQRTQKAVLAREILERGLNQMMEELNAKTDVARSSRGGPVPERKPLEIQLDWQGVADLELLARRNGVTPEELAATIMNRALDRMTRPPKSRSNVASIGRKG